MRVCGASAYTLKGALRVGWEVSAHSLHGLQGMTGDCVLRQQT